jgi:hypothetical protein
MTPERWRQVTAHRILGLAYERKGPGLASAEFQQLLKSIEQDYPAIRESTNFPRSTAELAHAYAVSGRRREALQLLSELTELSKRRSVSLLGVRTCLCGAQR